MRKPAGTTQSIVIFTDVLTHPAPAQLKSRDYGSRRFLLSMNAEKINLRNVTLCAVGLPESRAYRPRTGYFEKTLPLRRLVLLTDQRIEANARIGWIPPSNREKNIASSS